MSQVWYYVADGERKGPVNKTEIQQMIKNSLLQANDFVWTKGYENWVTIADVSELMSDSPEYPPENLTVPPVLESKETHIKLSDVGLEKSIFIRVGPDRGLPAADYGPFNIAMIKKLFHERRVNEKTLIYLPGLENWKILAEFEDFSNIFNREPIKIDPQEKRKSPRRPFIARMFLHDDKKLYEGLCRDISIGGMQVLVDSFQAQAGQVLSFNVHPENDQYHFVASGKVVRVLDGDNGFSFRFINLSDEAKNAIENYIKNES